VEHRGRHPDVIHSRQPTRDIVVLEAIITGAVLMVALASRYPGVTQATRDFTLGAILVVAGAYGVFVLSRMHFPVALRWVVVYCVSLIGLYAASVLWTPTPSIGALRPAIQLSLVFGWLLFVYATSDQQASRAVFFVAMLAFVLVQSLLWARAGFPFLGGSDDSEELLNKNILGAFTAAALFFMLAGAPNRRGRLARVIGIVLALALLLGSGSRDSQLAVLTAAIVYLAWPAISRRRWSFHAAFAIWAIASSAFVFYYLELSRSDIIRQLAIPGITDRSKYSIASLYSGREYLWPVVLRYIAERPLLGWGGIDEAAILMGAGLGRHFPGVNNMGTHDLYLLVALQGGLIGLALLLAALYSVWLRFYHGRREQIVRLAAASFIGICVHQLFETSLIQTNISIGVLFWAIIAIGVRKSAGVADIAWRDRTAGHS
jgi:O-antigen ligase